MKTKFWGDSRIAWFLLAAAGFYGLIKQLGARGGARDEEVYASLEGDEIIPHPMVETTHAITIYSKPEIIWKWLIQSGYRGFGRAGWYSDFWFFHRIEKALLSFTVPREVLNNDPDLHSANEILPQFQRTHPGDIIPDGPPGSAYFIVKKVIPENAWVLYSDSHIKYLTPNFLHGTSLEAKGEFTWVFVIKPLEDGSVRLILRNRGSLSPRLFSKLIMPVIYITEAIIPQLILRGIKQRAENYYNKMLSLPSPGIN